jgi:hypothetical protein
MWTYFSSPLEPRRRHERALLSVVQEAFIQGVSTRAVDQLAEALGLKGISKDQVSRICKGARRKHFSLGRRLGGQGARRARLTPSSVAPCQIAVLSLERMLRLRAMSPEPIESGEDPWGPGR